MLEIELTNEQKVKVTLAPKTAAGKPAPLDGEPVWTVIAGAGPDVNLAVDPGSLSAFLISNDTPGDIDFQVEADADLGAGVETITELIRLHVAGAKAANLGITNTPPEPK